LAPPRANLKARKEIYIAGVIDEENQIGLQVTKKTFCFQLTGKILIHFLYSAAEDDDSAAFASFT